MKKWQLFVSVFMSFACFAFTDLVMADGGNGSNVLATVNSQKITKDDIEVFVKPVLARAKSMGQTVTPEMESAVRKQWTEHMISRVLLLDKAKAAKVTVSDADVEKGISSQQYSGIELSADKLKELVKGDMMINKVIESEIITKISIADNEIVDFFNQRKDELKDPEKVKARHILFKVEAAASQEEKDKQMKKAKEVLAEAKAGKTEFSELAKKYSDGPSGPNGGDLGSFGRGRMVPSFEEAAFALKPNDISDIVETQFGYHIIKVEEKTAARSYEFDEIKESIRENLKMQRSNKEIEKFIDTLRGAATIKMME